MNFEHVPHPAYACTPIVHVHPVQRISNLGVEGLRKPCMFGEVDRNMAGEMKQAPSATVQGPA